MNNTTAPEVDGQTESSKALMRGALETMRTEAAKATEKLESGDGTVRTIESGKVVDIAPRKEDDERREAIIEKVGRFLDVKVHGPRFIGSARGKLFVGEYPRQQDILDVQVLVGNAPLNDLSVGQLNTYIIDELRKVLFGWIPISSPKAQVLRAYINQREDWDRMGIKLNPVEWMASRDPYLLTEEITPLWTQYITWKREVEPTKEEIDFYYSLM